MERSPPRRFMLVCVGALLCGLPTAAAQSSERATTPASQVAPLPAEAVAPTASGGAAAPAAQTVPLAYSQDQPPPEVLNAKLPPVQHVAEGPYSDEEEAHRADYREWRLHRFDHPFTIGLSAGYGVALDNTAKNSAGDTVTLVNPYQLGFGLQLGYTTPRYNIYMGAAASYYLGEDELNPEAAQTDIRGFSVLRTSIDLGYEFMMPWLRIRPLVSLGLSTLFIDSDTYRDQYNPFFGIGLLLAIPMGPLYVGLDMRMDFVGGRSLAAANTMGVAGVLGLRL